MGDGAIDGDSDEKDGAMVGAAVSGAPLPPPLVVTPAMMIAMMHAPRATNTKLWGIPQIFFSLSSLSSSSTTLMLCSSSSTTSSGCSSSPSSSARAMDGSPTRFCREDGPLCIVFVMASLTASATIRCTSGATSACSKFSALPFSCWGSALDGSSEGFLDGSTEGSTDGTAERSWEGSSSAGSTAVEPLGVAGGENPGSTAGASRSLEESLVVVGLWSLDGDGGTAGAIFSLFDFSPSSFFTSESSPCTSWAPGFVFAGAMRTIVPFSALVGVSLSAAGANRILPLVDDSLVAAYAPGRSSNAGSVPDARASFFLSDSDVASESFLTSNAPGFVAGALLILVPFELLVRGDSSCTAGAN
mmetsp:Transcript_41318/g.99530  ORF Transcript_41318/g.99530 Transcript_41318/m.99530 type:complete len:359 (-) Transcript_41318:91-1167(-)